VTLQKDKFRILREQGCMTGKK